MAWARAPKPLDIRCDVNEAEAWQEWKKMFEIYLQAAELSAKSDAVKVGLLRNLIGHEANKVYETFTFAEAVPADNDHPAVEAENPNDYATVIRKFDQHFKVRDGRLQARLFFDCDLERGKNQSFSAWVNDVRCAAQKCQYPKPEVDSRIRDKLIATCRDSEVIDRLMEIEYDSLTLLQGCQVGIFHAKLQEFGIF